METSITGPEMEWHTDGHQIFLRINKAELEITTITCPHGNSGKCWSNQYGCIVRFFISRFGLDCNVGVCPAADTLEICWSLVGDKYDLESCQLWFVPMNDEAFNAWLITRFN